MSHGLIFDIGLHKGYDAEFYLKKGFDVLGVEADPLLCEAALERLQQYCADGRMKAINKAIYYKAGETVSFFKNHEKDDWGSLFQATAEKGVTSSEQISVKTTTLDELMDEFGTPYYLKCDIEGGDHIVLEQLVASWKRPPFLSVEANAIHDFDLIEQAGYQQVYLVNQWMHPFTKCPNPAFEGDWVDVQFHSEMSGLFGKELPLSGWISMEEARVRYSAWRSLHDKDTNLAPGWIDIHARQ